MGRDDRVDGPDRHGALDAVDGVELRRDLTELLGANRAAHLGELRCETGPLDARGRGQPALELGDPGVGGGARVDVA